MSLDDAADAGLVRAQFVDVAAQPPSEPDYETKTYAIGFVVDQVSSVTASSRRPSPTITSTFHKNSSGDEIANANFFYDNIAHVEASAYAH